MTADELEALAAAWRKPGSETSAAFALRSHMVAHVDEIIAALRERDSTAAQVEKLVSAAREAAGWAAEERRWSMASGLGKWIDREEALLAALQPFEHGAHDND